MIAACILAFGAVSLLLSGCSGTAATNAPTFSAPGNTSTLTQTSAVAANANVSVLTSAQSVNVGDNFDVTISVNTDIPTRGIGLILQWDPTKVKCVSAEQGTFYTAFADSNQITALAQPDPPTFDNTIGKFPAGLDTVPTDNPNGTKVKIYAAAVALLGGKASSDNKYPAPKGSGSVFILHMTAIASGTTNFTLSNVGLSDDSYASQSLNPKLNNGTITIK
jgi:hypothetical protein